jgi:periplasmic protein TonB
MYADRHAPRRVNRGSLGLSTAIVGGLVAAVMLSPTVIEHVTRDRPLNTYWVPPTPPPPPPEPLPRPEPRLKSQPTPLPRDTLVVTPKTPIVDWTPPPPQPSFPQPGTGEGSGAGGAAVEPAKPVPPVLTGVEVDPRYAQNFQPIYPPAEERAGRDGVVTLRVLVGVDGRVVRAEQVTATSEEFWRVTLRHALARWRFKPATRDGIPYEAWRTMTVRFTLQGG